MLDNQMADLPPDETSAEQVRATAKHARDNHRQTRCVMVPPDDLEGKRVLDLGCRNGLGAFKIAERAGAQGVRCGG